jgi:hypothetical protein
VVKPVRWIDYCTSMIELASCGDLKRLCPASRDFAGTLPDAAKCVADHQCAGGFCSGTHVPIVAICGTCMLLPVVGDACATDDDCNGGGWVSLICGASKRCEQRPPQLTCSALEPCSPVFECVDGKCQQGSLPEGSACSPTAGCAPGLGCGPGDVCVPAQPLLVGPGEPCTGDSPPTGEPARYCRGENTCERGVCVPITYASCGFSMLSCGWGAVCRTETNTCEPLATICP